MAAKSHLRNGRPVVVALSTNDALSGSAESIAALLNRRNYYFVPFGQDDPEGKPCSLQADFTKIHEAALAALGRPPAPAGAEISRPQKTEGTALPVPSALYCVFLIPSAWRLP